MISDDYKSDAVVEPYDLATADLLDHYVLRVPCVRRFLDFSTIAILVFLFMALQKGTTKAVSEVQKSIK
jgi:hypothetical protein